MEETEEKSKKNSENIWQIPEFSLSLQRFKR